METGYSIYAVFFSPTGKSKAGAEAIAGEIGRKAVEIDLTVRGHEPKKDDFGNRDIVVFGAPVYSGRLYKGAVERFAKLKGHDTPCIITVTYGNRDYDDALLELRDLVAAQGFAPFAGAALVAQHTYGDIQAGRPNSADLLEDRTFAGRAIKKLAEEGPALVQVPGNRPYKEGGGGGKFRPRTNENCVQCGLCAANCPEGAIAGSDFSRIDNEKCIACFRCIKICPAHAKNMDVPEYNEFAANFTKRLSERRENQYYL